MRALEELIPAIRSRRDEIEKARRLPDDLVANLQRTGVFGMQVPRALGGGEAGPVEILDAIETAARADGSVGWCVMAGLAANGAVGLTPEAAGKEVVADPNVGAACVFAPAGAAVPVEGGVRVTGRWPFASGVMHSRWIWLGCLVMENGAPKMTPMGPVVIHAWMPVESLQIHDTWFVSGLAGTGSQDVSAAEVFVPEHRIMRVFDVSSHRKEALYRMPVSFYVPQLAAVSLGIGRAALDEIAALAQTRVPTMSMAVLADKPAAQVEIARAEATLRSARALLREITADLWNAAQAGRPFEPRQLAVSRIACSLAVEAGATVTRTASLLAGGSAIHVSSSLQRHMRDADAVAHHFSVSPHIWEEAGRVFLGRQPTVPMF